MVQLSFGFSFHATLGCLLYDTLLPFEQKTVDTLIYPLTIEKASILADRLKFTKEYAYTRKYHYNSIPCNTTFNWDLPQLNFNTSLDSKLNFIFRLHYLQDFIQPFHNVKYQRGGNTIHGIVENHPTTLHKLWDTIIPMYIKDAKTKPKNTTIKEMITASNKMACNNLLPSNFTITNITKYIETHDIKSYFENRISEYLFLARQFL